MARRSHRPLFRPRKSWSRRVGSALSLVLIAVALFLGLVYLTLPWTTRFILVQGLERQGWGPADLKVARFDASGIDLQDVTLAKGAISLKRATITYSPLTLLRGRVDQVSVNGLRATATISENGIAVGPLRYPGTEAAASSSSPPRRSPVNGPPPLQHLLVSDVVLTVALPQGTLATTITADLTPGADRWDGSLTLDTRRADAGLFHVDWSGALSTIDPGRLPSKGTITVDLDGLGTVAGAPVSGRGVLTLATGDGTVSLKAADRIALTLGPLAPEALPVLPAGFKERLKGGAGLTLGGSKGGALLTMVQKDGVATETLDLDLGLAMGDSSLKGAIRGNAMGTAGGFPDMLAIAEIRAEANRFPTPVGEMSGRVQLTDVDGPLALAEGNAKAELTITKPAMGFASAAALKISGTARFRLDGQSFAFEPSQLAVAADDIKTTQGVAVPGRTTLTLLENTPGPRDLAVVFGGDGSATVTFALPLSARAVAFTLPLKPDSPEPFMADLPKLRIEGYVTAGSGRYDVDVKGTDGQLTHALADLQLADGNLRLKPSSVQGALEATLTRLITRGQKIARPPSPGAKLNADFKFDSESYDFNGNIKSSQGKGLGQFAVQGRLNGAEGRASVTVPRLQFGADGIPARDIVTSAYPLNGLAGTAEVSMKASWKDGKQASSGKVDVADLSFQIPGMTVAGLSGTADLTSVWPPKSAAPVRLSAVTVALAALGMPLRDLVLEASLPGDGTVAVRTATMAVAGGQISLNETSIPLDGRTSSVGVTVSRLDLGTLVAQGKVDGLTATGSLSGTLPLLVEQDDVKINDGRLRTDGPGRVSYRPASPPAALSGGGETVLKALSNFEYDGMTAILNGSLLKELTVTLAMRGKNPDLYGGYPIAFNLNLGGQLGAILRQGVVSYGIAADMAERLKGAAGGQPDPAGKIAPETPQ